MGTTRLIFLKHPNTELVRKFIQVLSEFFKIGNYYENSSTLWKTTTDVLLAYKNGEYKKSNVLNAIMAGKKDPNNILFTTLFNVYPSSFTYFDDFMNYVGYNFKGMVYSEDYDRVNQSIWEQIHSSDKENREYVEYRIKTKKGKIKQVRELGHLVYDERFGNVFYVLVIDGLGNDV